MTEYNVIASATKMKPVCVLTVVLEDGTIDYLEIEGWMAENAQPLIGTRINVSTTNRTVVPSDIKMALKYPDEPTVG
jgi:hypothetical protein